MQVCCRGAIYRAPTRLCDFWQGIVEMPANIAGGTMVSTWYRQEMLNKQFLSAVKSGDTEEVLRLLNQGADVNAMQHGWTALMYAASMEREKTLRLLLARGADVHRLSAAGRTALQVAEGLGHTSIAGILREAGSQRASSQQLPKTHEENALFPKGFTYVPFLYNPTKKETGMNEAPATGEAAESYLLLDMENLMPSAEDIHRLKAECKILCFSKAQDKISVGLAMALMALQTDRRCEFILTGATGKNALDFHIAFYLGVLTHLHSGCSAYVISRDSGYDSLIQWINQHTDTTACRISCFDDLPANVCQPASSAPHSPKNAPAKEAGGASAVPPVDHRSVLEKHVQDAIQTIAKFKQARPRKRKTLINALNASCQPKLSSDMLAEVLQQLVAMKQIAIDGNDNVSYPPFVAAAAPSASLEENAQKAIADLTRRKQSRPRKRETLMNTLAACFQHKLSEDTLAKILRHLVSVKKCVVIDSKDNVTYAPPITVGK